MLQHALRIGLRRRPSSSNYAVRKLNTPISGFDQSPVHNDPDARPTRDNHSGGHISKANSVNVLESRSCDGAPMPSTDQTNCSAPDSGPLPQVGLIQPSRESTRSYAHNVARNSRQTPGAPVDPRRSTRYSVFVDVDSLAPHEMTSLNREKKLEQKWISDEGLGDVLKAAMTRPFKRLSNRLPHPISPQELELRLHQAMTFTPLPSLAGLINYHDTYPTLQSAPSYNFLVQLAIRHTSYSKAFRILRCMEEMGIEPDDYSKVLYVRLLVRIGRWNTAWQFIQQELTSGNEQNVLPLLLELLGHCKPTDFGSNPPSSDVCDRRPGQIASGEPSDGAHDPSLLRKRQKNILAIIPNHLPSHVQPPVHFILTVVRHLLQNSRADVARAITLEWISHLPKNLSNARKRHCHDLLHLHLAFSHKGLNSHFILREFVKLFLARRRHFQPNSTTLFLLLRGLTRAKGRAIFHALQLVHSFRKTWGTGVIDRRVRRRVASIALREGRLNVARTWLELEDQASVPRRVSALQRQAVGEQAIRLPRKIRRTAFVKLMPGIDCENRKWRWVKRRHWMLERSRLSWRSQAGIASWSMRAGRSFFPSDV